MAVIGGVTAWVVSPQIVDIRDWPEDRMVNGEEEAPSAPTVVVRRLRRGYTAG